DYLFLMPPDLKDVLYRDNKPEIPNYSRESTDKNKVHSRKKSVTRGINERNPMKLLTHLAALALLFSPLGSQAGLLSIENSTEQIEKVTLAKAAVVQIDEQPIPLSSVGAGLRAKKVL